MCGRDFPNMSNFPNMSCAYISSQSHLPMLHIRITCTLEQMNKDHFTTYNYGHFITRILFALYVLALTRG